jgi:quinol monooxygenase YgiN
MTTVIVHHQVADFDAWKPVYDEHGAIRRQHGCLRADVYRSASAPNDVTIVSEFPSADAAQAFASDPSLKEAMGRAGVQGAPDIHILDQVESVAYEAAS